MSEKCVGGQRDGHIETMTDIHAEESTRSDAGRDHKRVIVQADRAAGDIGIGSSGFAKSRS